MPALLQQCMYMLVTGLSSENRNLPLCVYMYFLNDLIHILSVEYFKDQLLHLLSPVFLLHFKLGTPDSSWR